jgi:uncharacterized protein (TIGR02145 family)
MKRLNIFLILFFYVNVISVLSQVPSYVPTNGLVGWWPFNGNANDESGNGNNGTVNGASLTSDRFGVANKAYSFDGINDYIRVSNSTSLNNSSVSISGWLNTNNLPTDDFLTAKGIVGKWWQSPTVCNSNYNAYLLYLTKPTGLQNSYLGAATNFYEGNIFYTSTSITTNNWYHFVFIHNATGGGSLYINGNLINSNSISGTICNSINDLIFGADVNNGSLYRYFNGKLDDIGIWNRSLNQQEISNLYTNSAPPSITISSFPSIINCDESAMLTANSTSVTQPCIKAELPASLQTGLVGYWPFCGNANDASGNGNNGTVNGATLTADRFGNANSAYSFDGVDDFIDLGNGISLNQFSNEISVVAWVKGSSSVVIDKNILSKYGCNPGGWSLETSQNTLTTNFTGCGQGIANQSSLNNDVWTNIVGIREANQWKIYVNGNLTVVSIISANYNLNSGYNLIVGVQNNNLNPSTHWNGKIDDIAIYNRALTASEIQQLYNLGNVSYSWSTGATTPSISVSPTQTTSYACTATNSAGSTTSSVTVTVADTLTWTGAVDTDWHKACNWSPEFVPKCCNSVKIPLTTNQPIIAGVAASKDITIQTTSGALLTVNNGANLQIQDCPAVSTTNTCPVLALLTTTAASSITQTTAVSGGTITYQGSSAITARGVCWSTSPNPTLSNSFSSNGSGIGTFTSNLVGLTGGTTYYVRAYATNGSGTSYGNQVSFVAINPQPAYPLNSVFCESGPTLVIDVTNPTTGKTWMDRNLGAMQVAMSSTDVAAYGDLYQWGRGNDGHQCRNSATTTTLSSTDQPGNDLFIISPNTPNDWRTVQNNLLWQGMNGINNPCPSGYRLPTETEFDAERLAWSANTSIGALNSPLKISMAGYKYFGNVLSEGAFGNYWSSTVSGTSIRNLNFSTTGAGMSLAFRSYGMSVRCIKN